MTSPWSRAAAAFAVLAFALLFASHAESARRSQGIPKSAPAFTKFIAAFIRDAVPRADVSSPGRLRLDLAMGGVHHTADLHDIFKTCHRAPDECSQATSELVAAAVSTFKAPAAASGAPTLAGPGLRIIVRTSAFVDRLRHISGRNHPVAQPLAGDLWLVVVNDLGDRTEIIDEQDLPALKMTPKDAFMAAMGDTAPFASRVLSGLADRQCAYVLGGDYYITSIVAFPGFWAPIAHHCHDSLIVAIPDWGSVVYGDGSRTDGIASLRKTSDQLFATGDKPLSSLLFRWTPKGWQPVPRP